MTNAEWIQYSGYKFSDIKIEKDQKNGDCKLAFQGKPLRLPNKKKTIISDGSILQIVMYTLLFVTEWLDAKHDEGSLLDFGIDMDRDYGGY